MIRPFLQSSGAARGYRVRDIPPEGWSLLIKYCNLAFCQLTFPLITMNYSIIYTKFVKIIWDSILKCRIHRNSQMQLLIVRSFYFISKLSLERNLRSMWLKRGRMELWRLLGQLSEVASSEPESLEQKLPQETSLFSLTLTVRQTQDGAF